MANLLGQNIGTNYKGILNLNTLNGNLTTTLQAVTDGDGNVSPLTLSTNEVGISRTIALSAGSSNVRLINETYTINNSGAQTGTATGIFLNATETALNGMGHNLMDLQRGGVSQFLVDRIGIVTAQAFIGTSYIRGRLLSTSGIQLLEDTAGGTFNRIQFGGTTNAFPAIKRNGAAIDFRLADDSGFCNISANNITCNNTINVGNEGKINGTTLNGLQLSAGTAGDANVKISNSTATITPLASAVLQIESTTKGFLPPRMTEAQRDLIASPATGLIIYNTTTNVLNFYNGSAWGAV
jgi:hypothetical protein